MNNDLSTNLHMSGVIAERLPYPRSRLMQQLFRSPILLWRMGYGPVLGRLVLILSHIGRRSGKVRRTALEYHAVDGRIYVFSGWENSDWFNNIQVEPRVTVQTSQGELHALARILNTNSEFIAAHRVIEQNPLIRTAFAAVGIDVSLTGFLAAKERYQIVTFDPIDAPTPPALEADLKWVTPLMLATFALGFLTGKKS